MKHEDQCNVFRSTQQIAFIDKTPTKLSGTGCRSTCSTSARGSRMLPVLYSSSVEKEFS